VRYQSRPESYIAPIVIDTHDIDAGASATVAGEIAFVRGPFSLQGEFISSFVEPDGSDDILNFYGLYAYASWYLTGESRAYDRSAGAFKRLIPRKDFDFGKNGAWGALEAALRFSYTDLNDGDVNGGRLSLMMGALNWYLQPHVKWIFNAGIGNVAGGAEDGQMIIFQTRVGVDF
jgi:phosphate-selective porin OprO/OprP